MLSLERGRIGRPNGIIRTRKNTLNRRTACLTYLCNGHILNDYRGKIHTKDCPDGNGRGQAIDQRDKYRGK